MDDSILAHLHTTMDCLERTRRLHGDGRHLRVRWEEDGRHFGPGWGIGSSRSRVVVEHVHFALKTKSGKTAIDVRPLERLADTVTAHHRLAAAQALQALHTATNALGKAWVQHPVLEPLLHSAHPTGRNLALVASRSRGEDTFHLGLGSATLTTHHTAGSDHGALVAAVRQAMSTPMDGMAHGTPLVLAGTHPQKRYTGVQGHPQAWAALVPIVCADQRVGVWALEQRIGLEDAPWPDTLVPNTLRQAWKELCQRVAAIDQPLWSSKLLLWRNGTVDVGDARADGTDLHSADVITDRIGGWMHSQAGLDALDCAERFLHTLVRELPAVAGGTHAPPPRLHLAHNTRANGCGTPTLHAFGSAHRTMDDCAALAGVPHGDTTWMAIAPNANEPCAVFQTDSAGHAVLIADRFRGIGPVDLYKLVATPTS
jgi:hypothetical protein